MAKDLAIVPLFDLYGGMLTEKQRDVMDLYYNEDLSLSEIAQETDISRQGVRDIIQRAEALLLDYEKKTGIVSRFLKMQADVAEVESGLEKILALSDGVVHSTAEEVMKKVQELKG